VAVRETVRSWNFGEVFSVQEGMRRILPLLCLLAVASSGCVGSSFQGDCSGGTYNGERCIPDPGVRWTDAKANAAALEFTKYYKTPVGKGKLTRTRCRVVARFRFYEAESVCTVVLVAPNVAPRRVVVAFSLSGHGIAAPDCRQHWKSNPYCSATGRDDSPYERAEQRAAIQVSQMRIPPLDGDPLVNVTCRVGGGMAICSGQTQDKRWIRSQQFTVDSRGALEPVCQEPPPSGVLNIFCAQ
jgi:hypothetical protein